MNLTWLYVLAIYGGGVWLARRFNIDLPARVAALFYILVLMFLWRPMTQAFVNLPVDFVSMLSPWGPLMRRPRAYNQELNDLVLQIVPWAEQVRDNWKSLHLPLWNARSGSGYPLLANGQSSALSILRIITLPLSLGHAFTAEAALKILIALTFTFLYCRKRGWSELASVAGAIAFGFSTFIIVWLHFPIISTTCFFPAVMYALELLAERITYPRFVFAALIWGLMIFGGHPETVSHVFFLAIMTVLWIVLVERRFAKPRDALRFIGVLCAVLVVAAIIASPFLAPLAEGLKKSKRYQELQAMPNAIGYYSDWTSRIILIAPQFFGETPVEPTWGAAHAESISGFAGILGLAGWFALLLDAIVTRRFRTREFFFVVMTPVILGIILAWPIVSTAFHAVFALAANARLRLLLCFVSAIMTAALIDRLERGAIRVYLIGIACAAAVLLYFMVSVDFPHSFDKDTALIAIFPSVVVLLIASLAPIRARAQPFVVMLLLVAIIAELFKAGGSWNPVLPERLMYPQTPLIAKLRQLMTEEGKPCRMVASGPTFFPNTPAMFGFQDIRAHDPMSNGRYLGTLRVVTGYDTSDYFAQWKNFDTRLLDFLNTCYIVTSPGAELKDTERYAMLYDGRDGRIFRNNDAMPRFYVANTVVLVFNGAAYVKQIEKQKDFVDTAILKQLPVENDQERTNLLAARPPNSPRATLSLIKASDTEYELTVTAPRYTMIATSLPWWPGWRITRNDEDFAPLQANGPFLAFVARPGTTRVRVFYDPMTFKVSSALSLLTLASLAAFSRESLRRRLRSKPRSE
jgi:uncharacterized membrane protein YfhO